MLIFDLTSAQYPTLLFYYVTDIKRVKYAIQQQTMQYCWQKWAAS